MKLNMVFTILLVLAIVTTGARRPHKLRPKQYSGCPDYISPICGNDGYFHQNECFMLSEGVEVAEDWELCYDGDYYY